MDTFDDLCAALPPDMARRAAQLRPSMKGPMAHEVLGALRSARYFNENGERDYATVWLNRAERAAALDENVRAEIEAIVGPEDSEAIDRLLRLIVQFIRQSVPRRTAST